VFRRGRLGAELTGPDLTVDRIEEEQLRPTEAGPVNGAAGGAFQEGEISHA